MKPSIEDVTAQFEARKTALAGVNAEISQLITAADQADVEAVLAGKEPDPGLRTKAATLSAQRSALAATLPAFETVLTRLRQEKSDELERERRLEIEALKEQYRGKIRALIPAFVRLLEAQREAQSAYRLIPRDEHVHFLVMPIEFSDGYAGDLVNCWTYIEHLCNLGYAELIPESEPGRAQFERKKAEKERDQQQAQAGND